MKWNKELITKWGYIRRTFNTVVCTVPANHLHLGVKYFSIFVWTFTPLTFRNSNVQRHVWYIMLLLSLICSKYWWIFFNTYLSLLSSNFSFTDSVFISAVSPCFTWCDTLWRIFKWCYHSLLYVKPAKPICCPVSSPFP